MTLGAGNGLTVDVKRSIVYTVFYGGLKIGGLKKMSLENKGVRKSTYQP